MPPCRYWLKAPHCQADGRFARHRPSVNHRALEGAFTGYLPAARRRKERLTHDSLADDNHPIAFQSSANLRGQPRKRTDQPAIARSVTAPTADAVIERQDVT
jgi:hypothetical protein